MALSVSSGEPSANATKSAADFKMGKLLGNGTFADVFKAKELATGQIFAVKVLPKKPPCLREKENYFNGILMEKGVLLRCKHPSIVQLYCTFQDSARLYFVLEYAPRGELLSYLRALTCLDVSSARFYTAEILAALEYLHTEARIVHRDIKPENVLLSADMHIKLVDFASAILLDSSAGLKPINFTGTPQYVSPEMLNPGDFAPPPDYEPQSHLYLMDIWALGCILFQLISGRFPFRGLLRTSHEYEIFQKILSLDYTFPLGFEPLARDLIQAVLMLRPCDRLGSPSKGGHLAIRQHPFFAGVDWTNLIGQAPPQLVPNIPDLVDDDDWDQIPAGYRLELNLELGLSLVGDGNGESCSPTSASAGVGLYAGSSSQRAAILKEQARNNVYHRFVREAVILKQGILKKRRGLSAKSRMFLLTEGPRLYYIDPRKMVCRGEVPWSASLTLERKRDNIFLIVTPGRTYILECVDEAHCTDWLDRLQQVLNFYFQTTEPGSESVAVQLSARATP